MARLFDLRWRLMIAGDAGRTRRMRALAALTTSSGSRPGPLLADPEPARWRAWEAADLFALATRWEGYAAAVAEALRRGIPVVVSDGGAAGALVTPEARRGLRPGRRATSANACAGWSSTAPLRAEMAEAAWQAGQRCRAGRSRRARSRRRSAGG